MKIVLPTGLSEKEASLRQEQWGVNELPQEKKDPFWKKSTQLLKEPMILLLVAAATIYLFVGDIAEGLLLVLSVLVVVGISLYQERKSENALAALREISSPRALVIRDGVEKRIPAKMLVPDDIISLHEGDRVPADALIVDAVNLSADESLLSGESLPVRKAPWAGPFPATPLDVDGRFKIFSSTLIVSGTAVAKVLWTGSQTEVGKIGQSLQSTGPEELSLNKEIRQIVKLFAWAGAVLCGLLVVIFGLTRGDWVHAMLMGLATEMALLPEEFPVILTIFLAMGAWRLSKLQVLVRQPRAIERLGAISILCVDKTGTLTKNQMTVVHLHNGKSHVQISPRSAGLLAEEYHELVEYGVLASHIDPFDPMEKAIRRLVEEELWGQEHLHRDWDLVRDYPLSDQRLAMSCVWRKNGETASYVIATKGAPEAVMDLCHFSETQKNEAGLAVKQMAQSGLRVLAVAKASFPKTDLPADQHDFNFQWIGLLGLEDPLRPEVPEALRRCQGAGVRVVMMTGDYPETARKIGERAGLDISQPVLTGADIETLSEEELGRRLPNTTIFARVVPAQKLRIVKAFKGRGHVVAMTGDGVNDAPSLKWADVGIAMGARGTDVAREAADIVLLDDNFASIVAGIERGRIIFNNIKKAMSYIAAVHLPIAGLALLPVLLGWPLILLPAHIVFLELIIDPACSLLFESQGQSTTTMQSPPRSLQSRLFTLKDLLGSLFQGGLVLLTTACTFGAFLGEDPDGLRARTMTFIILVLSNLGLIFANITDGFFSEFKRLFREPVNLSIVFGLLLVLLAGIQIRPFNEIFKLCALDARDFAVALIISATVFVAVSLWIFTRQRPSR